MGKGHWEALIIEISSLNYSKVGAKMTNLEWNEIDVPGATGKGPSYKYFRATKFLPVLKDLFDNPHLGEEEEEWVCNLEVN